VLGRIYLSSLLGMYELAVAVFLGGPDYMPLCLLEVRLSPQLHTWIFGYHQHSFGQSLRFGGFRPVVFMDHGLMVGLWMTMATLAGFWLWRSRSPEVAFPDPPDLLPGAPSRSPRSSASRSARSSS
jgi:hypothetical protein